MRVYRAWGGTWMVLLRVGCPGVSRAAGGPAIDGRVTIVGRDGTPKSRHDGAVVFLDELEHPTRAAVPTAHAVIRQTNKRFDPEILPILAGTTVDFPNDDTIFHNVFSLSKTRPFDLGMYAQGSSRSVTFDEPGLVKIYCNIHPQMIAYILVLANPHFTMTDQQGRFVLPDLPLGEVIVRSWYPQSREQPERKVVVEPQGIHDLNLHVVESFQFEIREETVSIQHKNKWGQDYPSKY